jgi:hypothetical protein
MVTRKPVPSRNPEPASSAPYPASPSAPSAPDGHASAYQPPHDADLSLHRTRSSSASSHNTWNSGFSSDHEQHDNDQPARASSDIPASLRVGRSQPSAPAQQSFQSHNPYHNLHNQSQSQTQPPLPPLQPHRLTNLLHYLLHLPLLPCRWTIMPNRVQTPKV